MNLHKTYDQRNKKNAIPPKLSVYIYTLNHKKRDILFLSITLANLRRFL